MEPHIVPQIYPINILAAVLIACVYITLSSCVKEPQRQHLSAIIVAGAGAVYWNSGLGVWEYAFGSVMLFVAFKGLSHYYWIGIGWLMHTGWDIVHHLYAQPLVPFSPSSSAGCAICDSVLAAWFFMHAPSLFKKKLPSTL